MTLEKLRKKHKFLCQRKAAYKTKTEAETRVRTYRADPKIQETHRLNIYTCLACGLLHIGHEPKWQGVRT